MVTESVSVEVLFSLAQVTGSTAGRVDVGIGKRRMCSHRCGTGGRILAGDGV